MGPMIERHYGRCRNERRRYFSFFSSSVQLASKYNRPKQPGSTLSLYLSDFDAENSEGVSRPEYQRRWSQLDAEKKAVSRMVQSAYYCAHFVALWFNSKISLGRLFDCILGQNHVVLIWLSLVRKQTFGLTAKRFTSASYLDNLYVSI